MTGPPAPDEPLESCLRLLQELADALRRYHIDFAVYPPSGNAALVRTLLSPHPNLKSYLAIPRNRINGAGQLVDPWGRPLFYRNNKRALREGMVAAPIGSYILYSRGPDGRSRIQLDQDCKPRRRPRS